MTAIRRGQVWEARLNPTEGSEQAGTRPVLVISRDAINASSPVIIVVPVTDQANKRRLYPSHVPIPAGEGGLTMDSVALCEQVRAIACSRLIRLWGEVETETMAAVRRALMIAMGL